MQVEDVSVQEKPMVYAADFFELAEIAMSGDVDDVKKYLEGIKTRASYQIYEDDFSLVLTGFFDTIEEIEITEESLTKNGGNVIEFGPYLFKKKLSENLVNLMALLE